MRKQLINKNDFQRLYNQGLTFEEIADKLGFTHSSICRFARKHGIKPAKRERTPAITQTKLIELHNKGLSFAKIAKKVGLSANTISQYAKRYKIKPHCTKFTAKDYEIIKKYGAKYTTSYIHKNFLPQYQPKQITKLVHYLVKDKPKFNKKHSIDESFFEIPNVLNCYYAGWIAADCGISEKKHSLDTTIKMCDAEILENFRRDTRLSNKVRYFRKFDKKYNVYRECARLNFINKKIIKDLDNNFKIGPRKSLTLEHPELEGDLALAYIKGFLDGDGGIRIYGNNLCLQFVGTLDMLSWIALQIKKYLNLDTFHRIRPKGKIYDYTIGGKNAYKIGVLLNNKSIPGLKRKWERLDEWEQNKKRSQK